MLLLLLLLSGGRDGDTDDHILGSATLTNSSDRRGVKIIPADSQATVTRMGQRVVGEI